MGTPTKAVPSRAACCQAGPDGGGPCLLQEAGGFDKETSKGGGCCLGVHLLF